MGKYPLETGHVGVRPDTLAPAMLRELRWLLQEQAYPMFYDELHLVETSNPSIQLYIVRGQVAPHIDEVPAALGECRTLGFVIEDSQGSLLTGDDGRPGVPLSPGCVFRINPRQRHGTVLARSEEERHGEQGVLAFVVCDYPVNGEPDPEIFAAEIGADMIADLKSRRD